jgi:peptide subunit release factor 1 (eRF1)
MPVQATTISGYFSDVHAVPAALTALRTTAPPAGGVLSVYLDTTPARVRRRTYLLTFRDGCRRLASELAESEGRAFNAAVAQAERFLTDLFVPRHPGVAIFTGQDAGYLYAVPLPRLPEETFAWDERPLLAPLEEVLDEHERVAVALVDRRKARLFTVFVGAIEERQEVDADVPGWKTTPADGGQAPPTYVQRYTAPSEGVSPTVGGSAVTGAQTEEVRRHMRQIAGALLDLWHRRPFDRLFLGGPKEILSALRTELPAPLHGRLAGELRLAMEADEPALLRATRAAAEEVERRDEVTLIRHLLEAAATPRAVLGPEATLAALSDQRVHQLVIADTFAESGRECPNCGRLAAGQGPCPTCGAKMSPLADVRERAIEHALAQGATLELVSGDAAAQLLAHGGLGAWTRY